MRVGNDASGGWLGHARLRIIDLTAAAHQPMRSADGRVALTYNGEVYNFRELRAELERRGARFRSTGDTEVVLRAYEAWGDRCVERLDGMFALAIWDERDGSLLLARDRTGKKPLFFGQADDLFLFGSEIKALFATGWLQPRLEPRALAEYLTFGYVPHPRTLLEEIEQVPPASLLKRAHDGTVHIQRYWSPPLPAAGRPGQATLAQIADTFDNAVRRRLVADVPVGAFLSGGVDSSLVVESMSRIADGPVHTFSIGFPEEDSFDERAHARAVAERFGTNHIEFAVRLDAVGLLDRLIWHHDQPFGDSSAIPTFVVSQLAAEHVKVVLNGDGGDELFGGYDRFSAVALAERVPHWLGAAAGRTARLLPRGEGYYNLHRRMRRFGEASGQPVLNRYQSWIAVIPSARLPELVRPEWLPDPLLEVEGSMSQVYARVPGLAPLDQVLLANFETYLPGDLAVKMDRMSMAHSLEARSPFLDTRLIELLFRIPAAHKVGMRRLKPLMREAFRERLPDAIWNRRKHGFGAPMHGWFRGPLGEVYEDEVLSADARSTEYLDPTALRAIYAAHRSRRSDEGFRLWTLLALERWLRLCGATNPLQPPPAPVMAS